MSKATINWTRERGRYGRRVLTTPEPAAPAEPEQEEECRVGCYACGGYDGHTAVLRRVERIRPTPGGPVTVLICGHTAL
jgi:hypothetical protein